MEEINTTQFDEKVLNTRYAILDFYSTECPPCEKLAPVYSEMNSLFGEYVSFYKIFRQENKELAAKYEVSGSPSVIFFKDGKIAGTKLVGYITRDILLSEIKDLVGKSIFDTVMIKHEAEMANGILEKHQLIIVGGGISGSNAAIQSIRNKVDTLMITPEIGGSVSNYNKIYDYLSYPEIKGFELAQKMSDHLASIKANIVYDTVTKIEKNHIDNLFIVQTSSGKKYSSEQVIFTAGTTHKKLNIEGEEKFLGVGVSYCATCDASFFADKTVAVIGGGDSALNAAIALAEKSKEVYLIYRKHEFSRAEEMRIDSVMGNSKIKVLYNEEVQKISGDKSVEKIILKNGSELNVQGVFIELGLEPQLNMLNSLGIETDMMTNHIKTDKDTSTNIKGLFAAGNATICDTRNIMINAAQGVKAAKSVYGALKN